MNDQPLVSVLMTAYNREKYIAEAIESILASTYTNFELIVVDDCSKDSTVAIARRYAALDSRIKVFVNERNLGDYPNRNKAASYARGEYLKYVDSDDYIYPHTLSVMLSAIEQFPDAGFGISSRTKSEVTFFNPERAYRCHFFERGLLDLGPTATIIRRNIFEEMGGFKMIRNVSDFDFWLRAAQRYGVVEMTKELVFWREHEGQEINIAPHYYLEYVLPIIKAAFANASCPLPFSEQKIVLTRLEKATARTLVKSLVRGNFSVLNLWRKHNLSVLDLF